MKQEIAIDAWLSKVESQLNKDKPQFLLLSTVRWSVLLQWPMP